MLPPSPSPSPSPSNPTFSVPFRPPSTSSSSPLAFSPPLIAMVVVVAAAFIAATYSRHVILLHRRFRQFRRRRRLLFRPSDDIESSSVPPSDGFHVSSPFGLHDSVIKSIPLSTFSLKNGGGGAPPSDGAVCLLEFEERDCVRTLPACGHSFHVDCIDVWLRSHANCPLCRAGITFRPEPIMAGRIRPSLEDILFFEAQTPFLLETSLEPLPEAPEIHAAPGGDFSGAYTIGSRESAPPGGDFPGAYTIGSRESPPVVSGEIQIQQDQEDLFVRRDFLMKRSYSFSFERNLGSERLAFEPATASPWRYRKGFWGKRASPFGSVGKSRMFSFRYYHRGMKSPFFRRRGGFFPLSSERGSSSRRSKSMASPMFMRSSASTFFSSSRMRSGDPEALLSPDRFNRR